MENHGFQLIDERDVRREGEVDAFRVAFWHGQHDDSQDLTSVAVFESSEATLDETLSWAKRDQIPPPRLIEIFAMVCSGTKKDSVLIARYDSRPPLDPGETRDLEWVEGAAYLHS